LACCPDTLEPHPRSAGLLVSGLLFLQRKIRGESIGSMRTPSVSASRVDLADIYESNKCGID
jgi:hypothetical protein